jgi:asparagine synthase (glutamine-hydrolysing)
VGRLGEEDLEDLPIGARPGLSSASLFHDRLLTGIAKNHGATALFTGHGGDSVFFQHPTALVAGDPSFPRRDIAAYAALAKWSRQSVWTVAAHAFHLPPPRGANKPPDEALAALPIAHDVQAAEPQWAGELAHLPPAKRLQIVAIATDRSVIGPSWRSRALTVVHPLLSQPLIEWSIAADAYQLTQGRRDRALAREAFGAMLPACVTERRGKGVLAKYFGRCLCASVPFLRTFLLDGLLVRHGVLDQTRLEPMLDEDFLMRFDCYAKLRSVILAEHWARVWQDRMAAMRAPHRLAVAAAS